MRGMISMRSQCWLCLVVLLAVWSWSESRVSAQEAAEAEGDTSEAAGEAAHGDDSAHATDGHAGDSHAGDSHAGDSHAGDDHAGDDHAGDDHHDPYDLSHGNATDLIEDPSEFKSDLAIWTFVVFLLLLLLLYKFAWGPIISGLDAREAAIADKIDEAKRSADEAAAKLQQYEARLAAATEEAQGIVSLARQDAEHAKERILGEAQEAAQRERQRAIDDITLAKNAALQEITEQSVVLAETMAGRLLQRELQAQDRTALITEALEQLSSRN